jgi:hypothetical protein
MIISTMRLRELTRESGGEIQSLACSRDITGLSNQALSSAAIRFYSLALGGLPMFITLRAGVR